MKALASIFACLILVTMSPAAMEAFGQISGATILSGTMDLGNDFRVRIVAMGIRDGVCWEIESKWENGYPQWIKFLNPQPVI